MKRSAILFSLFFVLSSVNAQFYLVAKRINPDDWDNPVGCKNMLIEYFKFTTEEEAHKQKQLFETLNDSLLPVCHVIKPGQSFVIFKYFRTGVGGCERVVYNVEKDVSIAACYRNMRQYYSGYRHEFSSAPVSVLERGTKGNDLDVKFEDSSSIVKTESTSQKMEHTVDYEGLLITFIVLPRTGRPNVIIAKAKNTRTSGISCITVIKVDGSFLEESVPAGGSCTINLTGKLNWELAVLHFDIKVIEKDDNFIDLMKDHIRTYIINDSERNGIKLCDPKTRKVTATVGIRG